MCNRALNTPLPPFPSNRNMFKINIRSSHPEVFLGKELLKICSKYTGEHPCRSVISIKFLQNFIEITLRHGCSLVHFLYIFRTPSFENNSGRLQQHGRLQRELLKLSRVLNLLPTRCLNQHYIFLSFLLLTQLLLKFASLIAQLFQV